MTEAEKILIKHLKNRKCKEHIYTDDDVYLACLDAINEALRLHGVSKSFYCQTEKETGKQTDCLKQCSYCRCK